MSTRNQPTEHTPIALEQEFLRMQHEEDFGPRNISSGGWRLTGQLDTAVLQQALDDVVVRHEALRTTVTRGADGWQQEIGPPRPVKLVVRDLPADDPRPRDVRAEEFFNEIEAGVFDASEFPLLWAFLGRFDERDSVLVLVSFLPQIDVWSVSVIMRDVAECYAARKRDETPDLVEPRQYREYVTWQRNGSGGGSTEAAFEYWRATLRGAAPILLTADRESTPDVHSSTQCHRFSLGTELAAATVKLSRSLRGSPFMVLFAVYLIHLNRRTGATDGVVWTLGPGPGRRHQWTENTVGYFVNMFPLRTDLAGCETFRQLVDRVRTTCTGALVHEVPFIQLAQHALGEMSPPERDGLVRPAFQMSQNPVLLREKPLGDVTYTEIRRRHLSQPVSPEIPDDGFLWTMEIDPDGELIGDLRCATERFDRSTLDAMVTEFHDLLSGVIARPDSPLSELP